MHLELFYSGGTGNDIYVTLPVGHPWVKVQPGFYLDSCGDCGAPVWVDPDTKREFDSIRRRTHSTRAERTVCLSCASRNDKVMSEVSLATIATKSRSQNMMRPALVVLLLFAAGCGHSAPPPGVVTASNAFPSVGTTNARSLGNDWYYFENTIEGVKHRFLMHQVFRDGLLIHETVVELRNGSAPL